MAAHPRPEGGATAAARFLGLFLGFRVSLLVLATASFKGLGFSLLGLGFVLGYTVYSFA